MIVGGLGGEPKYQEQFDKQITALTAAARRTTGNRASPCLPGEGATREALEKASRTVTAQGKAADTCAVFLVGHGSYDGEAYKLNLPGPDIDGDELGALLGGVPARSQLIVNTTSASGAVLESWAADGRTLITATQQRLGAQRDAVRRTLGGRARRVARRTSIRMESISGAGGVRLRVARDGGQLREAGHARDRASAARGCDGARFNVARLGPRAGPRRRRLRASKPSAKSSRGRSRRCARRARNGVTMNI